METLPVDRSRGTGGSVRRKALFEEALSLIETSYHEDRLTVEDLGQKLFASRRQLQRAFAEAGTSVKERLHAVRMEHAARLLHQSSLPVADIAHSVGYRQPAQFAKAFRRYYRLSPSEWRHDIVSDPTMNEVISVECQCGCATSPLKEVPQAEPRPARDEHDRDVERRLEELDRRLQQVETAA